MWSIIKVLLFGAFITISSHPISIGTEWTTVKVEKPFEVLNQSASLELDVTSYVTLNDLGSKKERYMFPKGCVEAELSTIDMKIVKISNEHDGSFSYTNEQSFLRLSSNNELPVEVKFTGLRIRATCPLVAAGIYWRNGEL